MISSNTLVAYSLEFEHAIFSKMNMSVSEYITCEVLIRVLFLKVTHAGINSVMSRI